MAHPHVAIAPAPNNGSPTVAQPNDPTMPYTCMTCTRRKVKCDKISPVCSTCRKSHLDCVYQAPLPRKRKRRPSDKIYDRLDRYERLLKDNGLLPQQASAHVRTESRSGTPLDVAEAESRQSSRVDDSVSGASRTSNTDPHKHGKIIYVAGKQRWVDSILWRSLGEDELDPVSDEGEGEPDHGSHHPHHREVGGAVSTEDLDPLSAGILRIGGGARTRLIELHPTYDHAMAMWRAYVECVEPVVKILHIPTTLHMLQRAATSPGNVSRTTECICFAVYHFAVVAMSDVECVAVLGETRSTLRARYHNALRQSLVNAQFLRTTDIGIVQAFVLFCLSVRTTYDQQTFWILTGVAVRLGQRMGLHRDGEDLGLKPFDVQLRRRLFWQLLPLDALASQLTGAGTSVSISTWSTKQPLNINDEDMWPDMTEPPPERSGATDMIFCLVRYEIGRFHKKANPTLGNWPRLWELRDGYTVSDMEALVAEIESIIEAKYLRYCDTIVPIHLLTSAMARGGCAVARFRIRLERLGGPQLGDKDNDDNRELRMETIPFAFKVLDYAINCTNNSSLAKFRWHLDAFFTWDAVVFLLNELRRERAVTDAETVWPKLALVFTNNGVFLEQKRALHVAVGTLALKAWNLQPDRSHPYRNGNEPDFIRSLRESAGRRAAARTRRLQSKQNSQSASTASLIPTDTSQSPLSANQDLHSSGLSPFLSSDQMDQLFNLDDMDWSSWDQLIKNPDEFPSFSS